MDPRCGRCGSPLVPAAIAAGQCRYCGAVLHRPPPTRWRWFAHRPPGVPGPPPPTRRAPYTGPPRYRETPRWGFTPSVWIPAPAGSAAPMPPSPARELRSSVILGRATAVMCLIAAASEAFRYVLLVRGRTEVLPAGQVRLSDALVVAAGWAAPLLAVATALTFVPALARTEAWAVHRARAGAPRSTLRRLLWLLVPVWNLYGAGVVVAEVDAVLRMEPPASPEPTPPDRLRWRSSRLPTVPSMTTPDVTADVTEDADSDADVDPARDTDDGTPQPQHRSPHRLVSWWWVAWALGGLSTLVALVWSLNPSSLQARADLVELHVLVDVVAAAAAWLTAAVARSWSRLVEPPPTVWPAGWILPPPARGVTVEEPARA